MTLPRLLFSCLLLLLSTAHAVEPSIPAPLEPWRDWVVQDQPERDCPYLYNAREERLCRWPSALQLTLDERGGRFEQRWSVQAKGWVALPGGERLWPQEVKVDGQTVAVVAQEGIPRVALTPGEWRISGTFHWDTPPDYLPIPAASGLLDLTLNGQPVALPELDSAGRLWLRRPRSSDAAEGDRLGLRVFRKVDDDIPLQVETRIELNVSGRSREVLLGPVVGAEAIPLTLDSPLPARLEPDQRLRVQVRPGRWWLTLTTRAPGPVSALTRPVTQGDWPEQEVWSLFARHDLRQVSVRGAEAVDPQQTDLPKEWRALPAYLMLADSRLTLDEQRRGDPQAAPDQLDLERELWLDFDGGGYTLRDHISGRLSHSWRLEMDAPASLGRAVVNGDATLITRLPERPPGVEIRHGDLNLVADGRIEGPLRTLPAVAWLSDVNRLATTLHLPPGWRLFSVSGVDGASQTWLQQWTLMDLFLVLIIALATRYLRGRLWGLVALVTLTLTYHESDAPRIIWLLLLAWLALLKVLPSGRARRTIGLLHKATLASLVIIALPFLVDQVRQGLYPVLEQRWAELGGENSYGYAPEPLVESLGNASYEQASRLYRGKQVADEQVQAPPSKKALRYNAETKVQTGPGIPAWDWHEVRLEWNGPVEQGHSVELYLIPPFGNTLLAFARVALIVLFALGLLGLSYKPHPVSGRRWQFLLLLALLTPLLASHAPRAEAEVIPPQGMLDELRARLLTPPSCLPACADLGRLALTYDADNLTLRLELHSGADIAVPLPGRAGQWLAQEVRLDDATTPALSRDGDGQLWVHLSAGVHQLLLRGPLPRRESVMLHLPLPPRQLEYAGDGWQLAGLDEQGRPGRQLELRRLAERGAETPEQTLQPGALPPLLQISRTLAIGLEWGVTTQVVWANPGPDGVVTEIPLLAGESVTSGQVQVREGKVIANLPPGSRSLVWHSVLEPTTRLTLTAPSTSQWLESWRLEVSPHWHLSWEGIPVVSRQQADGSKAPLWRPWPGEQVTIQLSQPEGVAGETLTLDRSEMRVTPGPQQSLVDLDLTLRASHGGPHPLRLPEGARLQQASLNGRELPIRGEGAEISLPLLPGSQKVSLSWKQPSAIGLDFVTPALDLGIKGVNGILTVALPADRWLLYTGGPSMGPAVLIWGVLLVLLAVAFGLGRTQLTPLRTHHWFLLGIGISQVHIAMALVVVAWLLALAGRERLKPGLGRRRFNLMQVGLVLLTLVALLTLFVAIQQGLLGRPEMQVIGNGSHGLHLRWYQDRLDGLLPSAWVISLPLWVYRLLMLAWALWLAFALLRWLRWGWGCFSHDGVWRQKTIVEGDTPVKKGKEAKEGTNDGA